MKERIIFIGIVVLVMLLLPWAARLLGLYADYGSWVLDK